MTSKKYSLEELKTLLSHTHDEVQHILLNPSHNNNQQYFENFTTISLRTIKYINHYLNYINNDQHIGSVIESIISSMNHSLVEYRSRNVFTSSCVVPHINLDQNEEREEDEIYHFMNTRNKSIPPQCLGNPELERQRLELREFLQTMEKKKTTFKEPKKSLELPISETKKIKFLRKTTYDPSLTPIKEEDNNLHSLEKLPAIHDFGSRPSQEDAQTQTQFVINAQRDTQKDQDEFKSQAESALVSEVRENTVISENKVDSEVVSVAKAVSSQKKKSNKRLDIKGKSKKKAKITDVPFFSRQGSRKGIKVPESAVSEVAVSINQCSLKLVNNISENLALNSKEIDISINNVQSINISVTFNSKIRRPSGQNKNILQSQDGTLGQSVTFPLKIQGDNTIDQENSVVQSPSWKRINKIKETFEEDILEPMEHPNSMLSSLERNSIQKSTNYQRKHKNKASTFKASDPQPEIIQLNPAKIQFEVTETNPTEQIQNTFSQKRSFTNKRLTILNMSIGTNNLSQAKSNQSNVKFQAQRTKKQQLQNQEQRQQKKISSSSQQDQQSRKICSMGDKILRQTLQFHQQQAARKGCQIRKEEKMLTVNEVKHEIRPVREQQSTEANAITDKPPTTNTINSKFYSTFDSFGKFGNQSPVKFWPQRQDPKEACASIGPMIKIVAQPRSEASTGKKLDAKQKRHKLQSKAKDTIISKMQLERKSNHLSPVNANDARKLNEALAQSAKKHSSFILRNSLVKEGKQNGKLVHDIIEENECKESDGVLTIGRAGDRGANSVYYTSKSSSHPYKSFTSTVHETRKANRTANSLQNYRKFTNGTRNLQKSNTMSQIDLQELSRGFRYKNKRQVLLQYLDLIELTHQKFCGQNCTHLQHLFKKKGPEQNCIDQTVFDQLLRLLKRSH